ncbi:DoxX family protein [Nocardioides donggukensis]|uniref:DoxX family protein n=1 Tax=Nocardioides donggukensis TaxID=2774019 RepID=A0A927Q1V7_9ACTN|nr:DoxX family protein [Nocardioides donggukensis]MBD8870572.1 DoxX family protein [Nocardioides donggukensis]
MDIALWVIQILLAGVFAMAGGMKVSQPRQKLASSQPWVEDFSSRTVRLIGVAELLAAIGLVLPAAVDVLPVLTPLAATGLAVLMLLAANTHRRRGETPNIGVNAVLLVLAVIVAWGRFGPYSF